MGRSRGGLSAKIPLLAGPQGRTLRFALAGGLNSLLTIDNAGEYEILATIAGSQNSYPFYVTATPKAQRLLGAAQDHQYSPVRPTNLQDGVASLPGLSNRIEPGRIHLHILDCPRANSYTKSEVL